MTNHECRMKLLSKCLKWRFVPKRGRVADGWFVSLGCYDLL
jgi:hypothetical protein